MDLRKGPWDLKEPCIHGTTLDADLYIADLACERAKQSSNSAHGQSGTRWTRLPQKFILGVFVILRIGHVSTRSRVYRVYPLLRSQLPIIRNRASLADGIKTNERIQT